MAGIALSRLHIIPKQFGQLTPVEFEYALQDYMELRTAEIDFRYKTGYEVARYMVTHLWNMQGRHLKSFIKDPQKSFPFHWDVVSKKVKPIQSAEEMKNMLLGFAGITHSKKKNK